MSSPVKVALAGISGYGDAYLETLLSSPNAASVQLIAVVDPAPERCGRLGALAERGIPILPSVQALLGRTPAIELLMIATPIHLHSQHTCLALQAGANVLCEKPLAGTLRDALKMAEAQRTSPRFAAIGFQWSFSQAIQDLKRDVMAGVLGRPVRLKSLVSYPRGRSYFRRNDWAGRIRTAGGSGVLDSPVHNATAHFLHNMFYVLGATRETSAAPAIVQAELYRANEIENYDTAALRCRTECGAEVLFYTTHAVTERIGPRCRFEFEHATVEYDFLAGGQFVARFRDGRVKSYGSPNVDRHEKIWQCVDAVRTGVPVACGIEAAMSHMLCVVAAQESAGEIREFPRGLLRSAPFDGTGDVITTVDGLHETLVESYEGGVLPSEHGRVAWSHAGRAVQPARVDGVANRHAAAVPA